MISRRLWMPAFAGMTQKATIKEYKLDQICHSDHGRNLYGAPSSGRFLAALEMTTAIYTRCGLQCESLRGVFLPKQSTDFKEIASLRNARNDDYKITLNEYNIVRLERFPVLDFKNFFREPKTCAVCKNFAAQIHNPEEPEPNRKKFITELRRRHRVSPKENFRRFSVPSAFLGGKVFASIALKTGAIALVI